MGIRVLVLALFASKYCKSTMVGTMVGTVQYRTGTACWCECVVRIRNASLSFVGGPVGGPACCADSNLCSHPTYTGEAVEGCAGGTARGVRVLQARQRVLWVRDADRVQDGALPEKVKHSTNRRWYVGTL